MHVTGEGEQVLTATKGIYKSGEDVRVDEACFISILADFWEMLTCTLHS